MNLVKEKQGGLIPTSLKRWPLKLIKHFVDTTRVSPSPAGPAGRCPLDFLNLINLKFRKRAPNWCCILYFTGGLKPVSRRANLTLSSNVDQDT